jgi:amidase
VLAGGSAAASLAACAPPQPKKPPAGEKPKSDVLGDLDGVALARRIRDKEITPLEAVDAAIARAQWADAQLNFVATEFYDRARERAKSATDGVGKPFFGVPTLIKDLTDVAGVKTRAGCRALRDNVAKGQPPYVDALLASGLVPFAKSTTPEFGFTASTEPLLTGATRNPWSLDHSPGGSSGGAAAAVAAGVVPVAHASDGGGSIRIPANCTNLFGMKPSRGRIVSARDATDPLAISISHCVSRSVRDSLAWLAATEAREGTDLAPMELVFGPVERRLRIGWATKDLLGREPAPDVVRSVTEAAALLERLGHDVREHQMPLEGQAFADAFSLYWDSTAAGIVAEIQKRKPFFVPMSMLVEPLTLGLSARFNAAGAEAFARAVETLKAASAAYDAQFTDVDVVLTPVTAEPPLKIGELAPDLPFADNQKRVLEYVGYTPVQNAAGAPAMSVPLGMSGAGLPIGVMFSARRGDEATLFGLAYELEQAQPWIGRKPTVWAG